MFGTCFLCAYSRVDRFFPRNGLCIARFRKGMSMNEEKGLVTFPGALQAILDWSGQGCNRNFILGIYLSSSTKRQYYARDVHCEYRGQGTEMSKNVQHGNGGATFSLKVSHVIKAVLIIVNRLLVNG